MALMVSGSRASAQATDNPAVEEAVSRMRWAMDLGKNGPDNDENSAALLALARDSDGAMGVRGAALRAYAAMAARRHDVSAGEAIWKLRDRISGFGDATTDALVILGATGLPYLVPLLRACGGQELAKGQLDDPSATIEMEEAALAASAIVLIVDRDPKATTPELATSLINALECGDATVRMLSGRALGLIDQLGPNEAEAVRKRVLRDRRPDVRSFCASVLAAHALGDPKTVKVLEHALADRAEVVRLGAANALLQLERPARVRATLKQLTHSRDQEIARLAESVLRGLP
jgi:HEAT repeats